MIINTLVLTNIRSYISQEFIFNSGINVLYGDIGSGKSTVLQAIEVALFGLKKGEGNHLLRKGEKFGVINLKLQHPINKSQCIEISREFKKTSQGVTQSGGSVIVGNDVEELSTQELNAFIFKYFNFPMSFVSKDKTLMYRFTHYTPQEQLKEILTTSYDKRLEILRKVFNIDNYKQLQNALQLTYKEYSKDVLVIDTTLENLNQRIREQFGNDLDHSLGVVEKKELDLGKRIERLKVHKRDIEEKLVTLTQNISKLLKRQEQIKQSITYSSTLLKDIETLQQLVVKKLRDIGIQNDQLKEYERKILMYTKLSQELELRIKEMFFDDEKLVVLEKEYLSCSKNSLELKEAEMRSREFDLQREEITECLNKIMLLECKIKDIEIIQRKNEKNLGAFEELKKELVCLEEKEQQIRVLYKTLEFKVEELQSSLKSFLDVESEFSSSLNKAELTCPTCFQSVDIEHLQSHKKDLEKTLKKRREELESYSKEIKQIEIKKKVCTEKLEFYEGIQKFSIEQTSQIDIFGSQREDMKCRVVEMKKKFEESLKELGVEDLDEFRGGVAKKLEESDVLLSTLVKEIEFEKKNKSLFETDSLKLKEVMLELSKLKELVELSLSRKCSLQEEIDVEENKIKELKSTLQTLNKDIALQEKIDVEYQKQIDLERRVKDKCNEIISEQSFLQSEMKQLGVQREEIKKSIDQKDQLKVSKQHIESLQHFLREDMGVLCKLLEETLLEEIHLDLSLLIRELFLELVDDKELEVYLRDDFSISVEQNGFEVEVEQLSGGEKSALALSYRLALKKVIEKHFRFDTNLSYVMLDEPTDGFSGEQIQKFATILKTSEFDQIFLVSHDSNLLTSGEHIFTIEKENHVSKLV